MVDSGAYMVYTDVMMTYQGVKRGLVTRVQKYDDITDRAERLLEQARVVLSIAMVSFLIFATVCLALPRRLS